MHPKQRPDIRETKRHSHELVSVSTFNIEGGEWLSSRMSAHFQGSEVLTGVFFAEFSVTNRLRAYYAEESNAKPVSIYGNIRLTKSTFKCVEVSDITTYMKVLRIHMSDNKTPTKLSSMEDGSGSTASQ